MTAEPTPDGPTLRSARRPGNGAGLLRAASSRGLVGRVVVAHLLTRLVTVAALVVAAHHKGIALRAVFLRWDARWYEVIARHGYPDPLPRAHGHVVTNQAGFFPLLPTLARPFTAIGIPYWVVIAGEVLVWSTLGAVLIALVVAHYADREVAFLSAVAWSVFPTASVLSVGYAEGLFTMLAAATLLFLLRKQWWLAGAACALAGLTRPTAVVLVAALWVVLAVAVYHRRATLAQVGGAVLGALGVLAALGWIALDTGRADGWFVTEREGWQVRYDGGATLMKWAWHAVRDRRAVYLLFLVAVVIAVVLVVLAALRRPPLPVQLYLILGTVLALGQGGKFFTSPLRFLLPTFPLVVPAAIWLARMRPAARYGLLVAAGAISAGIGVYYFTVSSGAP